jgi:hypothetical protein
MSGPLQTRRVPALAGTLAMSEDLLRIVQLAADLVNSFDPAGPRDLIPDVDGVSYVVSDHPWPLPPVREEDVAALQELRGRLARVFAEPAATSSQQLLDELLTIHPPTFALGAAADGSQALLVGTDDGALAPTLATQMSLALSAFLRDGGADRITACEGPGCQNVAIERPDIGAYCSPYCLSRGARSERPASGRPPRGATRGHRRP